MSRISERNSELLDSRKRRFLFGSAASLLAGATTKCLGADNLTSSAIVRQCCARSDQMLVVGETVALRGTTPRRMLRSVGSIKALYRYSENGTRVLYSEGVDYRIINGMIARMPGSTIYDFNNYTIRTAHGSTVFQWSDKPRNPPRTFNLHAYVDYWTEKEVVQIPALTSNPLSGLVLAAGDSITAGIDTVGGHAGLGDRDSFIGLLRSYFSDSVSRVTNIGIDGASLRHLANSIERILDQQMPTTLLINYGMNDHGLRRLIAFESSLNVCIEACQARGVRPIITSFFYKNSNWEFFNRATADRFILAQRRAALGNQVTFVDVNALWLRVMKRKSYEELLGDNFHHPSNYGHRIYFSAMLPHLLNKPVSSADVPEYILIPSDI